MLMKWLAPLVAALAIGLAGCSTTGEMDERGDLVVTYAVMKLIEQSDDIAPGDVIATVDRVRAVVDTTAVVGADDLHTLVMEQIDLSGLSPADQFLVQHIIREIQRELLVDVDTGAYPTTMRCSSRNGYT